MELINVLIAEDHRVVLKGLRLLLEQDEQISIVGEASNGTEVLSFIAERDDVDVVISDIRMPEIDGLELISKVKQRNPRIKLLMLSMFDDEPHVLDAIERGASGYLLKKGDAQELIFAIKQVHLGSRYLSSELVFGFVDRVVQKSISASVSDVEFSERELEVLQLIAEGMTNQEMSDKLFLSRRTVEGHRQSLIEKSGSRNTAALIKYAVLNRLV
jgi:two-component system, NarL family, response regulator NreC